MKILIVTQKVDKDDPILGFFYKWIIEFSKKFESVVVICLERGGGVSGDKFSSDYLENIKVLSLGKENGQSRLKYVYRFYKYIWQERKNYDVVFVHMNPVYVVLGGLFWRLMGKKITLWYTHKSVDLKLRLAEKLVDKIFTASRESFRLRSEKVAIVGHGIDTNLFSPDDRVSSENSNYTIISVGRISEIKNQSLMVEAVKILRNKNFSCRIIFVGESVTPADTDYYLGLKNKTKDYKMNDPGVVYFAGSISPQKIIDWYRASDLSINLSSTGSLDKAVLEAMSSGLQVLTSNEAFRGVLPMENITTNRPEEIAKKILDLSKVKANNNLREIVVKNHNLNNLIDRIDSLMRKL